MRTAPWGEGQPPWATSDSILWADRAVRVTGSLQCTGPRSVDFEYDWTLAPGLNWLRDTQTRSQTFAGPPSDILVWPTQ